MNNLWKNAIWGVIVGDALGCPVQFESRKEVAQNPVHGMIGYRTFNMPEGTWTDDSALTLALMDSIIRNRCISLDDIMNNFVEWLENGMFTPYGFAFDIGHGTIMAIRSYERSHNPVTCGGREVSNNGNGSIMRIMPAVLYCIQEKYPVDEAVDIIHRVSALTHAHRRAKVACGLYYFMAASIVNGTGTLRDRLQSGLDTGFAWYEDNGIDELSYFYRLRDLAAFAETDVEDIKSSGYVVDTIEAAVWGLITADSFQDALLKIVNLGGDTDSIAAVAGGLAGLFYGYADIPAEWIKVIQRREWIDNMISLASAAV